MKSAWFPVSPRGCGKPGNAAWRKSFGLLAVGRGVVAAAVPDFHRRICDRGSGCEPHPDVTMFLPMCKI